MHKLYSLKENLVESLEKYGDKKDMSPAELDLIDKLAHAAKNVCRVIEYCDEGGYSEDAPVDYRYARSFPVYGRGRTRDSRGRYSSEDRRYRSSDDIRDRLQDLMYDAPNEDVKRDIHRVLTHMDTM